MQKQTTQNVITLIVVIGVVSGLLTGCNTTSTTSDTNLTLNVDSEATPAVSGNANTPTIVTEDTENTLYFTQIDGEYFLYLSDESYQPSEEGELYGDEIPNEQKSQFQQEALLDLPEDSSVFSFMLSPDNQYAFIVIQTRNRFDFLAKSEHGSTGMRQDVLTVFIYNISQHTLSNEFSNLDLNDRQNYILTYRINNVGKAAFNLYACWGCEAPHPESILWDPAADTQKNIGHVSDFEWLDNNNYRYKEFITVDCETTGQEIGECSEDPSKLEWINDTFE